MALFDTYILGTAGRFQNRIEAALLAVCTAISSEGKAVADHPYRLQFVKQILARPSGLTDYVAMFAVAAATDANCLSDATQGSTVPLTQANISAQELLVTDAHISNAVSAMFNAFVPGISV